MDKPTDIVETGPLYAPRTHDRLVDYDSRWPARYDEEKVLIVAVLGVDPADVEHIGSTAVPGLGAKPILDIMVAVPSLGDAEWCIRPLGTIGYEYRGEMGVPGRLFFRKGDPRTHHLHLTERGSDFWADHLLFCDYLRAHPEVARQYGQLKCRLMVRFASNIPAYGQGKASFIEAVVARARAERRSG